MIIQVRGNVGSGKSTVVKEAMERLGDWQGEYIRGRKKPLYYRSLAYPNLIVLGHYEGKSKAFGLDSLPSFSAPKLYNLLLATTYTVAIAEGLVLSEDVIWTTKLPNPRILFLTTNTTECLNRALLRRERMKKSPMDRRRLVWKLEERAKAIERVRLRLAALDVYTRRCPTEQGSNIIVNLIEGYYEFTR